VEEGQIKVPGARVQERPGWQNPDSVSLLSSLFNKICIPFLRRAALVPT
jgi:hypothetical protein